jgi:DNA-binding response OmpR family regulator
LLKRSKSDDAIDQEAADATAGSVLVLNEDRDACELVARLVESAGWPALRAFDLDGVMTGLTQGEVAGVVIDSLGTGISAAFRVLEEIRGSAPGVAGTAVIILAATETNRLFAFQSEADGFVVRPFHSDELLETVRAVLVRSPDERLRYRKAQLLGGATTS